MQKNHIDKYILISFSLILLYMGACIQTAIACEPTVGSAYHMVILKNNSPEFVNFTANNFLRFRVKIDGSYDIFDDRWSFRRGERFFIGVEFPIQLGGMSAFLKIMSGNKVLAKKPSKTIRRNGVDTLGYKIRAEDFFKIGNGAGIYSFQWWIGKYGSEKLAAIQLVRITN